MIPRFSTRQIASLAAGLAVLVAAIAVGDLLAPSLHPAATPSSSTSPAAPSPGLTPASSRSTDELVLFSAPEAGYELLIPASWEEAETPSADRRQWVGSDGVLMVSYGASILDGGATSLCVPARATTLYCWEEAFSYSLPFDPQVDGVGPLEIGGQLIDNCPDGCEAQSARTELGGEPANRTSSTEGGSRRGVWFSTFHDLRPVIVFIAEASAVADDARIERIRSSFRFLDPGPSPGDTPFVDPTELVRFENVEAGYVVRVPRSWGLARPHSRYPQIDRFYAGQGFPTDGSVQVWISVGERDGTVAVCQGGAGGCGTLVARTLDELASQLVTVPDGMQSQFLPDRTGPITLGGQPGLFKRPGFGRELGDGAWGLRGMTAGRCLGCPGVRYFAFTIDDGRPVVISINWWTIAFDRVPRHYLADIMASFRLVD